eukprot:2896199-Prymnesium_polylepis.1
MAPHRLIHRVPHAACRLITARAGKALSRPASDANRVVTMARFDAEPAWLLLISRGGEQRLHKLFQALPGGLAVRIGSDVQQNRHE